MLADDEHQHQHQHVPYCSNAVPVWCDDLMINPHPFITVILCIMICSDEVHICFTRFFVAISPRGHMGKNNQTLLSHTCNKRIGPVIIPPALTALEQDYEIGLGIAGTTVGITNHRCCCINALVILIIMKLFASHYTRSRVYQVQSRFHFVLHRDKRSSSSNAVTITTTITIIITITICSWVLIT